MDFCPLGAMKRVRLTRACYSSNPENCGLPNTGHHGFGVGTSQAGGGGRGPVMQTRTQDMVYLCVIVLQLGAEESAQAWEAGRTRVIALPFTRCVTNAV